MKFTVKGPSRGIDLKPLWEANVEVIRLTEPSNHRAVRGLFVSRSAPLIEGVDLQFNNKLVLPPGTMIAECRIERVTLSLANRQYIWTDNGITIADPALLLLQALPEDWRAIGAGANRRMVFPNCICIGGEIALDAFRFNAGEELRNDWRQHFRNLSGLGTPPKLTVHASGFSFAASAKLEWEDAALDGRFHVMMPFPVEAGSAAAAAASVLRDDNGPLRMTLDRERTSADATARYAQAFRRLGQALLPANVAERPRWAALEMASQAGAPKFFWEIRPDRIDADARNFTFHLEREELNLLVSDQPLGAPGVSPRSLCRTSPETISIKRGPDKTVSGGALIQELSISFSRGRMPSASAAAAQGRYQYAAQKAAAGAWSETIELANIAATYDAITEAQTQRRQQGLPAPDSRLEPVSPTTLWGFAPLEDGWAQLPFLNLTEQMYLDVFNSRPEANEEPLLTGAAAIGNDSPGLLALGPGEQPWSVTLLNAASYNGAWRLTRTGAGQSWRLSEAAVTFHQPEVALNGFLWLATDKPDAADALPTLENWLAALRMVPLRGTRPKEMFPSPFVLRFQQVKFEHTLKNEVSYPSLKQWEFDYQANDQPHQPRPGKPRQPVFETLLAKANWKERNPWRALPLLWRRHPALPTIQTLPLTQNQSPPNHPSFSRQLAPFQLNVAAAEGAEVEKPAGWLFGVRSGNAAAAWPALLAPPTAAATPTPQAATEWPLGMACLSLPGLVFDPAASAIGAAGFLPAQYKYGLPYTDELNALAQLPKAASPPDPDIPPEPPVLPLDRESYAEHWRTLAERAFLAETDASDALARNGAQTVVQGLIEPQLWPVTATLAQSAYPGSLTLKDGDREVKLESETALAGIAGTFSNTGNTLNLLADGATDAKFTVVAGSLAAQGGAGRLRDQRGLSRKATTLSAPTPNILKTPVQLETDQGLRNENEVTLCSLLAPVTLSIEAGTADQQWQLWFRDVPVKGGTFNREAVRSAHARGVNDPAANSRGFAHLTGYEWRLAAGDSAAVGFLPLQNFRFYPLTLDEVGIAGDAVNAVTITGRLQLPSSAGEQIDSNNAVRAKFVRAGARLELDALELAPAEVDPGVVRATVPVEWPLAEAGDASSGGSAGARLRWRAIAYQKSTGAIALTGPQLEFTLFDARWLMTIAEMRFPADAASASFEFRPGAGALASPEITIDKAALTIGLRPANNQPPGNQLSLALIFRWDGVSALGVEAAATLNLLDATAAPAFSAALIHGANRLPFASTSIDATLSRETRSIQLSFANPAIAGTSRPQLLPGMCLSEQEGARGFAVMSFAAAESAITEQGTSTPAFALRSGFVEMILPCDWGRQLQDAALPEAERVFGSSAGRLYAGYTLRASRNAGDALVWTPALLLNGFLEVKNLVSWPLAMRTPDRAPGAAFVLPASRGGASLPALDHTRHTMRVLLNQHEVPPGLLTAGAGQLLFDFASDRAWQFLAVVEHQLIDVRLDNARADATTPASLANDRRWTAVQEVRLLKPAKFAAFLGELKSGNFVTLNPASTTTNATNDTSALDLLGVAHGTHRESLLNHLIANPARGQRNEFDRLEQSLIVEAGAPHWIRVGENTSGQFSNLQYLPRGTQRAILSVPDDFASPSDTDRPWLLLSMPFLGRLQAREKDTEVAVQNSFLQADPIVQIDRMRRDANAPADLPAATLSLASWADRTAIPFTLSTFDLSGARRFGRLDPATLDESWYRLQNPPAEPFATVLPSVLAALPADSPGRLGRSATLRRSFDAYRHGLPPRAPGESDPQVEEIGIEQDIVWRRDNLFVIQGVMAPTDSGRAAELLRYGFCLTGAQIHSGNLFAAADRTTRHSAATMLPPSLRTDGRNNPQPVSFSVSPYLSLEFQPMAATVDRPRLSVAELLCLDPKGEDLRVVASQVWEEQPERPQQGTRENMELWGREVHARLAYDSPAAVLRVRRVKEAAAAGNAAGVAIDYEFFVLGVQPPVSLVRRTRAVRVAPEGLRFAEGQFGGHRLPEGVLNFELAPPQVRGVQPLYLTGRPGAAGPAWPWGLSALRFSVRHTGSEAAEEAGVVGKIASSNPGERLRLWWSAIAHEVQFALPGAGSPRRPRRLLPAKFRARAISSMQPALPNLPLPRGGDLRLAAWQPVLPGAFRHLILGARAGAPLVFRHQLICQETGGSGPQAGEDAFASGCVPVQHRAPRPVVLPANQVGGQATALRAWASHFAPAASARLTLDAADNAFIGGTESDAPIDLEVRMVSPRGGALPVAGNGELRFELSSRSGQPIDGNWQIEVVLTAGGRKLFYRPDLDVQTITDRPFVPFVPGSGATSDELLRRFLSGLPHGAEVAAHANVTRTLPPGATRIHGYKQRLRFPLRVARADELALPLRPVFVQFEDPEYNRRLASLAARSTRILTRNDTRFELTLATDRREYNAASWLFVVHFSNLAPDALAALAPDLVDARLDVTWIDSSGAKRPFRSIPMLVLNQLAALDLSVLSAQYASTFSPGDSLTLELKVGPSDRRLSIPLRVDIVAKPVIPAPEAGYALLRRQSAAVECARFAWGPQASRVELLNPDDLKREIVRRRAVFQWTDSTRSNREVNYAVQKIAASGATHFPAVNEVPT